MADLPDAILWDPTALGYKLTPGVKCGRPTVCSELLRLQLYRWLHVFGQSTECVIPDVLLAQLIWGARTAPTSWPKRWRQLLKAVPIFKGKWTAEGNECPRRCPIRDCGVAHGHFRLNFGVTPGFLGQVRHLAGPKETSTERPVTTLDFTNPDGVEGLRAVYHLPLLFSASPRSKISPRQGLLLSHLGGQVTRTGARVLQTRPDKAQVFTSTGGALAADDHREFQLADCPFLVKGQKYVAFNGNRGRRLNNKPHGYGLKLGTRAEQAGYITVAAYLKDLAELAPVFGLVAGGYDPRARRWYTLGQLKALGEGGREVLLRVYGPPDYRREWRATFYEWLGFDPLNMAVPVASGPEVSRARRRSRRKAPNGANMVGTSIPRWASLGVERAADAPPPAPRPPEAARALPPPVPRASESAPGARPAVPSPPPPTAAVRSTAASPPPLDPGRVRTDYEELLARARKDVEGRTGMGRRVTLLCVTGVAAIPAVIRYAVAHAIEPEVGETLVTVAREAYSSDPVLWRRFLEEQAEREGPDSPLRTAASRLDAPGG